MTEDLGEIGETQFRLICERIGWKVHKPSRDRFGWDYLVEVPYDRAESYAPLDAVPAPLEFRVQVKATSKGRSAVPISVSHMLRLSKLQMPVFFCLLTYDKRGNLSRLSLMHLGEDLISRTLRRVRELSARGITKLHKRKLVARWGIADALLDPLPESLAQRVADFVPKGMADYLAWKNNVVGTVGFDEYRITMDMSIEAATVDDLVDFFLGIKREMNVRQLAALEHRFGIPWPIETQRQGPAVLSIVEHPYVDAELSISKDQFSRAIRFQAKCYRVPGALELPRESVRLRVVSPLIELMLWPLAGRILISRIAGGDEAHSLEGLADLATAISWLNKDSLCRISIQLPDALVLNGSAKLRSSLGDWDKLASVTTAALALARRAGAVDQIVTSFSELMHHSSALLGVNGLADGAPAKITFDSPANFHPGRLSGFIKVFCIPIGQIRLVGVFAVVGNSVDSGTMFELVTKDVRLLRVFPMPLNEAWNPATEAELIKLAADVLSDKGIVPIAA